MGSATNLPHSASDSGAAALGVTDSGPRWAVGERRAPASRRELPLTRLGARDPHPLASTALVLAAVLTTDAQSADNSTELVPLAVSSPIAAKTELVVLQDGDVDPLGALSAGVEALSALGSDGSAAVLAVSSSTVKKRIEPVADELLTVKQQWRAHKDRLLSKFAEHTFKIKASMLETKDLESELLVESRGEGSSRSHIDDSADDLDAMRKSRERLEELERKQQGLKTQSNSQRGDRTLELSQSEYVARVERMRTQLEAAWTRNQKVLALRIAIKCVKLLGDTTTAPQLYPCVFVLVRDVLDTFGTLVFDRIKVRASEDEHGQPLPRPLGDFFTTADVNVHATETCRNWFYKTACIRELLPRIYMEIALLRCYRFLCDGEYPQIVMRISNMIRGIGDPLVALYTWLYLGLESTELLAPTDKAAVTSSLSDYLFTFHEFRSHKLETWLSVQHMELEDYLALHSPAVEWLVKCAAHQSPRDTFDELLDQYQQFSDCSMVLKHLTEGFGAANYAQDPFPILELARTASPSQFSKSHLYSVLALQLSSSKTFLKREDEDDDDNVYSRRLAFLNNAWSSVTSQPSIEQYMECAAAFMKLVVVHYAPREALILLRDVVRHLNAATSDELTPKTFNLMGTLIENVVIGAQQRYAFFRKLVPSSEFLTLLGMFKREASVGVARKVLRAFVLGSLSQSPGQGSKYDDGHGIKTRRLPVVGPEAAVAHTLLVLCCRVHDALDSLHASRVARNEASRDICAFISRLGYTTSSDESDRARDEEQDALLDLYVDCRRAFYKLESVQAALVRRVLALAMHVHHTRLSAGALHAKKAKKSRDLVKSCLAYAHITAPSVERALVKLELLVDAAKVALATSCLPQMDSFIKAAVVLIAELDLDALLAMSTDEDEELHNIGDSFRINSVGLTRFEYGLEVLVRITCDLVSVLIYAPSLTDNDAFYFVHALRKAALERLLVMQPSAHEATMVAIAASRVRIQFALLQLLALWSQPSLPDGRIGGVDSNDVLYGGDVLFARRVREEFSTTIENIVREIETLGQIDDDGKQASAQRMDRAIAKLQAELMLDFINLAAPSLSYTEVDDASSDPLDDEAKSDVLDDGQRRRRRRARGSAVLLRKCWLFVSSKLDTAQDAGSARSIKSEGTKESSWLEEYRENTRDFVAQFATTAMTVTKSQHPSSSAHVQSIEALRAVLSNRVTVG